MYIAMSFYLVLRFDEKKVISKGSNTNNVLCYIPVSLLIILIIIMCINYKRSNQ